MTTRDEIKRIFQGCLLAQQQAYVDAIVDQHKVLVWTSSGGHLEDEVSWTFSSRGHHYFVGLCSVVYVTDTGTVMYWTTNGGVSGFHSTNVHSSVYNTVALIRQQLALMAPESASFRHPLDLPLEIYRLEDPAAALVAADTYKQFL